MDGNLLSDADQFSNIDFGNFHKLINLKISDSNLMKMPLFDASSKLFTMYLSRNRIESISAIHFSNLKIPITLVY